MTEEELAELRAYKPAEVARLLDIPITRLETWVRENEFPISALAPCAGSSSPPRTSGGSAGTDPS